MYKRQLRLWVVSPYGYSYCVETIGFLLRNLTLKCLYSQSPGLCTKAHRIYQYLLLSTIDLHRLSVSLSVCRSQSVSSWGDRVQLTGRDVRIREQNHPPSPFPISCTECLFLTLLDRSKRFEVVLRGDYFRGTVDVLISYNYAPHIGLRWQ